MTSLENAVGVEGFDSRSFSIEEQSQGLLDRLMQENPQLWTPRYGLYSHTDMAGKVARLAYYLREQALANGEDPSSIDQEAHVSYEFLERAFKEYESEEKLPERAHGSFAFMVPTRIRREVEGESDGYMNEWTFFHPMLRRVDSNLAQRFLVGTPPFIVDQYGIDKEGHRGYMIFVPFFSDMLRDIGYKKAAPTYAKTLRDSFEFAKKIGADTVGLGATLPQVLFQLDKLRKFKREQVEQGKLPQEELDALDLREEGLKVTTGHAGTVWLIGETLKSLQRKGYQGLEGTVGIIGAGSIGTSTLDHLRTGLGYDNEIFITDDKRPDRAVEAQNTRSNVTAVEDNEELLTRADTIVCAAIRPIRLQKMGSIGLGDLRGKTIIDDSQPGCFEPTEVKAYGGQIVWPIGKDTTPRGEMTLGQLEYSGYGPVNPSEVWGCQLEAWLVQKYQKVSNLAVRSEVVPEDIARIEPYLRKNGIVAARLQAQGKYL